MSDAQALAEAAVEAYAGSGDQEEWDSAIEALASMAGSDFVINLTAARIGQRYGVETAALPWNPEDAQVRAGGQGNPGALFDHTFDVYTTLAEKFRQAAICGSAEPERALIAMDEEVAISYRVTDLGGEGADGANVQISAPSSGKRRHRRRYVQNPFHFPHPGVLRRRSRIQGGVVGSAWHAQDHAGGDDRSHLPAAA
jgi:hypothetical protein